MEIMMYLLIYYLLTSSFKSIECNYFMAATGMRELAELESELAKSFIDYYHVETERLKDLETFLDEYDQQNNKIVDEYVYNPVDAYKFVKRFTHHWDNFSKFQRPEFKSDAMDKYSKLMNKHSGFEDMTEQWGSIYAIIKLQETYRLEVDEITQGYSKHSLELKQYDFFLIGYYAMSHGFYAISILWLEEAYARYYDEGNTELDPDNIARLLEALIWDHHNTNNFDMATYYSMRLVELVPDSIDAQQKVAWYKYKAYHQPFSEKPKNTDEDRFGHLENRPWLARNNRLCRREEKMKQAEINKLFCYYYSPSHAHLLKPMQIETVYLDPQILYLHNLLTNSEIDYIVDRGRKRIQSAEVYSMDTGKITNATGYRIGKAGWIDGWEDPVVYKIQQNVGRLTGLNMKHSEPLQLMNYGMGGNYESHYDHATPPHNYSIFGHYAWGNRVATVLMYLTDVEKGGETVFTKTGPGVIISPKRGAAVLWYNLHRNGTGDEKTAHAGCPVLFGEKWIANLWIHEWGQEFKRRCTLNRNE